MIVVLLILLTVVPTLSIAPYSPYIIATLVILYLTTRIMKAGNLRSIRKLAEKKEEEEEDKDKIEMNRDKDAIKIKKEYESDFIESTTDTIFYVFLSFVISTFILHLFGDVPPLIDKVLILSMVLCLITVYFMYWRSPSHEDERKWQKHYKDFCKGYMDDRYQDYWREKREQKRQGDIREEHERRWIAKHGKQPPFEEGRFEDRRKGLGEVWGDRREDGRTEDRRQPNSERRIYLS